MGRSEWGIEIKAADDTAGVNALIQLHNTWTAIEEVGEALELGAIIKFDNKFFACISNGGGRDSTTSFIENYVFETLGCWPIIYYPFEKPYGWMTDFTYVWQKPSSA